MIKIVVTCEHATNYIPEAFKSLFIHEADCLSSHRGWDLGAVEYAKALAKPYADYYFEATVSRLLVELNRSLHHPQLFSAITRPLPPSIKTQILADYYFPYRSQVTETITHLLAQGAWVLHLSVHTFTPVIDHHGERKADIGLLFDPKQLYEKKAARLWKTLLVESEFLIVRFNYPYLGKSDSLVSSLRKRFGQERYVGLELEINQKTRLNSSQMERIKRCLVLTFGQMASALKDMVAPLHQADDHF